MIDGLEKMYGSPVVVFLHRGLPRFWNFYSTLWNEVTFIDPHWYTRRVKEAIHIRLKSNNINRDTRIEIPEVWLPTIKKHNNREPYDSGPPRENLINSEDRNALITAVEKKNRSQQSIMLYKKT